MFKNLRVNPDQKKLINLPEGWVTLFLAKTEVMRPFLYAAIIAPRDKCTPADQDDNCPLGGVAYAVQFTVENVWAYAIHNGYKYVQGGGTVVLDTLPPGKSITWTTSDECGRNEVFGVRIPPEDVLVAL
ncbi:TPA: hypothetical protein DDX30_04505 [Candidatus Wolfebacteria bacterium]|nr:hypothetical protein [Candidatus Wolfebacteria bacterium]